MTTADLDRLDDVMATYTRNSVKPEFAGKLRLNDAEMDRYNAWCDRHSVLADEASTAIPALVAEVRRMRRGLEAMTVQCDYTDSGRLVRCWPIDIRDNLLAGREWNDDGEGK